MVDLKAFDTNILSPPPRVDESGLGVGPVLCDRGKGTPLRDDRDRDRDIDRVTVRARARIKVRVRDWDRGRVTVRSRCYLEMFR